MQMRAGRFVADMTRQQHLNAYLAEVRRRRFRPGSHDCGLFVAGWVKRITGEDHGARWRGKYRSMKGLDELVKADGFESHIDYVASLFPAVAPALAQTGDLVVVGADALGILASDRAFVLRPDGLGHVSRMKAERAFSV